MPVIDRRGQKRPSTDTSRGRFRQRTRGAAKKALDEAVRNGNVTDTGAGGIDVTVPKRGIAEPRIHHGEGGVSRRVLPGNKKYNAGDRMHRPPPGGGGRGNQGSPDGEGDDEFVYHLNENEFFDLFFEDLALPNLTKKSAADVQVTKLVNAGFASSGPFNRVSWVKSKQRKMGRKIAAEKPHNERILALLKAQYDILSKYTKADEIWEPLEGVKTLTDEIDSLLGRGEVALEWKPMKFRVKQLTELVERLTEVTNFYDRGDIDDKRDFNQADMEITFSNNKKGSIPEWNEATDLRIRVNQPQPVPVAQAVMICVMDTSFSMDEERKDNAKRFYITLHRFLKRHYDKVEVKFVRHDTSAEEVNEKDFFYGTKSGGTAISTGLELGEQVMGRYGADTNIYVAQATDGGNFDHDNPNVEACLERMLPRVQGFFYTEIGEDWNGEKNPLWLAYENIQKRFPDYLWLGKIKDRQDVWPVFREFFKKRTPGAEFRNAMAAMPRPRI